MMDYEAVVAKITALADAMMRQDDAAVVAHFADDAVMIAPSGRFVGKAAIDAAGRAFNRDYTNVVIVIKQAWSNGASPRRAALMDTHT
jgi:ketosteroid isomerase-like protein